MGTRLTKEWFDRLEHRLREEAAHAGLLGHGGLVGNAREFFVRRVLGSFLPHSLDVGSGRVIDPFDLMSNQMDVVIFDKRFPAFRSDDGNALYPVEGVVATIEVKSTLTKSSLLQAMDNCFSVLKLSISVDTNDAARRLDQIKGNYIHPEIAKGELAFSLKPKTFVFGFRGLGNRQSLERIVRHWLETKDWPQIWSTYMTPRVIVAGKTVMTTMDGLVLSDVKTVGVPQEVLAKGIPYAQFIDTRRRFGWLASHLLMATDDWYRGTVHPDEIRRSVLKYLAFREYFAEKDGPHTSIMWKFPAGAVIKVDDLAQQVSVGESPLPMPPQSGPTPGQSVAASPRGRSDH